MKNHKIAIVGVIFLSFLISCDRGGGEFVGKWKHYYGGVDQFGDEAYIKWLVISRWGKQYKVSYHYGGNTNPPFINFVTTAEYKRGSLVLDEDIEVPDGYSTVITRSTDTVFYNGDKYRRVADDEIRNRE